MKRMIQKYFGRYTMMMILGVIYLLPLVFVHGAAVDYFLKIEGVPGESSDTRHKDWIIVESFSWGMSQKISGTGNTRTVDAVDKKELTFAKWIDKSSPILMMSTCAGIFYPKVEFSMAKAASNSTSYMKITLSDVLVSSYQVSPGESSGSEPAPMESLSLNFAKVTVEYYTEDAASGSITNQTTAQCDSDATGTGTP